MFRTIAALAMAAALHAQVFPSRFEALGLDRNLPSPAFGTFQVDPPSGAVEASLPLGPGIGEGGLRFVPTLRAHLAPQIAWTVNNHGNHRLAASSQATFSLSPGTLDLKLFSDQDSDEVTYVSGWRLWDGTSATFTLDDGFPVQEARLDPGRILRAYGHEGSSVGLEPHREGESSRPLVRFCTDGSVVLAVAPPGVPENRTPKAWGSGDHAGKARIFGPALLLVVRGEVAYEFSPLYDPRFEGDWANARICRYRLTAIRNPYREEVRITYREAVRRHSRNPSGFGAAFFRDGSPAGPALSLDPEGPGSWRLTYAASAPAPAFLISAVPDLAGPYPDGVVHWRRRGLPDWIDPTERLLVSSVLEEASGQALSFTYGSPEFRHAGEALTHRLLAGVSWSNGLSLHLAWEPQPYRRNDARAGTWQGYFHQFLDLGYGREREKRAWCFGVTSATLRDDNTGEERRTTYARQLPIPRWGTRNQWEDTTFQTLITWPDGQMTLESYVRPLDGEDGGPGSAPSAQIRTLAHLRHLPERIAEFPAGADPGQEDQAWRITTLEAALGQDGHPAEDIDRGAYPHVVKRTQVRRDTGGTASQEAGPRDPEAFARARRTRTWTQDGSPVAREVETTRYDPEPSLGFLARAAGSARRFFERDGAAPLLERNTELRWDEAYPLRLRSASTAGRNGPALETRVDYQADAGPGARLPVSTRLAASGLQGESGVAAYGHDALGRMTSIRPRGVDVETRREFDDLGRVVVSQDANGLSTFHGWDGLGRPTRLAEPGREATRVTYDSDGRGRTITRGAEWTHLRTNAFGEVILETRATILAQAEPEEESLHRAAPGHPGMAHRAFGWDAGGRPTWATVWIKGTGPSPSDPESPRTLWTYDARGRLIQETSPDGLVTSTGYEGATRTLTRGGVTTLQHEDALGRLDWTQDAAGSITHYAYHPDGGLAEVAQEARSVRQVRTWTRNDLGWLVGTTSPEEGITIFGPFHVTGLPLAIQRKGDGTGPAQILEMTYDPLGRMLSRRDPAGTVDQAFAYDGQTAGGRASGGSGAGKDRLTYSRDEGIERFRRWDTTHGALASLTTRVWSGGRPGKGEAWDLPQTFQEDAFGHRVQCTAGHAVQTQAWHPRFGTPLSVAVHGSKVLDAEYHPTTGNPSALAFAGGLDVLLEYRMDQTHPHALACFRGNESLPSWTFAYDARGRVVADSESRYTYDDLDRLTRVTTCRLTPQGTPDPGRPVTQSRSYDPFGNLTACETAGDLPLALPYPNFTLDAQERAAQALTNRIPGTAGGQPTGATYDPQGRLATIQHHPGTTPGGLNLTWDALGRVREVTDTATGLTERYAYTPGGLRTRVDRIRAGQPESGTLNLYDDRRRLVSQFDLPAGAPPRWRRDEVYLGDRWVAEMDDAGIHSVLTDILGSPRLVANAKGATESIQRFLPFGEPLEVPSTPVAKGFTGHEQTDASGLVYMQARFYLPMYGRFSSPDPYEAESPSDPESWNRYNYVLSNPVMGTDPSGMLWEELKNWLTGGGWNRNALADQVRVVRHVEWSSPEGTLLKLKAGYSAAVNKDGRVVHIWNSDSIHDDSGSLLLLAGTAKLAGSAFKAGVGTLVGDHGLSAARTAASQDTVVIGRVRDLQQLKPGERSLLDLLPNQGSPKANWAQNAGVLRKEMGRGFPIRDASPGDISGQFLNAERNLLRDRGWVFDYNTNFWNPPTKP